MSDTSIIGTAVQQVRSHREAALQLCRYALLDATADIRTEVEKAKGRLVDLCFDAEEQGLVPHELLPELNSQAEALEAALEKVTEEIEDAQGEAHHIETAIEEAEVQAQSLEELLGEDAEADEEPD